MQGARTSRDLRQLIDTMVRLLCVRFWERTNDSYCWARNQNRIPAHRLRESWAARGCPPGCKRRHQSLSFTRAPSRALGPDPTTWSFIWGADCFNFMLDHKSIAELQSVRLSQKVTLAFLTVIIALQGKCAPSVLVHRGVSQD